MDLHLISLAITSLFLIITISCLSTVSANDHDQLGFTVDLIHRDSPKSPFYNPLDSPSDRLKNALTRSSLRLRGHASKNPNEAPGIQAPVLSARGEYLMEIALGTPPSRILAIADTGSDITWTQCRPCKKCYKQIPPLFDPAKSRTYRPVGCGTDLCGALTGFTCSPEISASGQECIYQVTYGDRSHTKGTLGMETLRLATAVPGRPPVAFPRFAFGCGHDNAGTFDKRGSGIVGLANGGGSLVTQLGASIGHKFSYCLVPLGSNSSSKINFGSTAVVSGPGTITTPLLQGKNPDMFYYVGVKKITVGNKTITANYDTIIDSGTTVTFLPQPVYDQMESAVAKAIPLERAGPTGILNLCYRTATAEPGSDFPAPPITLGLGGGAHLRWGSLNTFVRVSEDAVCFPFVGVPSGSFSIIGNLAQMNFLVGYDLQKNTVSFKEADCTKN